MPTRKQPVRLGLQAKVTAVAAIIVLAFFSLMGLVGYQATATSIEAILNQRAALAETIAVHLDRHVIDPRLRELTAIAAQPGFDLADGDLQPEQAALAHLYSTGLFVGDVLVTDALGIVRAAEPEAVRLALVGNDLSSRPHIQRALTSGQPQVGRNFSYEYGEPLLLSLAVPLKNANGEVVGLAEGGLDPDDPGVSGFIAPLALGRTGYVQIVDEQGLVIASTTPGRVGAPSEHRELLLTLIQQGKPSVSTHNVTEGQNAFDEVIAFAPVPHLGWGVSVEQDRAEALAPINQVIATVWRVGLAALAGVILLIWVAMRQVTRPVLALAAAARRMADGDLGTPLPDFGSDEVGQLGRDFEAMRARLSESRELLVRWNSELEKQVAVRTRQLVGLQGATRHLTGNLSLEATLEAIAEESRQLLGADRCAVYLGNPHFDELTCLFQRGLSPDYTDAVCRQYRILAGGRAGALMEPVFVADAQNDPLMASAADIIRREGFRSLLILPLVYQGQMAGAFALYHDQPHQYAPEVIALGEAFAAQAAIALHNARLYTQSRATRDYYVTLLNSLHDEIVVINRDYLITDVNGPFLHKTGYTREQVVGKRCYEISHHFASPCWQRADCPCPVMETWQTGRTSRAVHQHYDAAGNTAYFDIAASPLFDEAGQMIGAIEACRDSSVEKQLEARLRAIYQLGHELVLVRDEAAIMRRVLEAAVIMLAFDTAWCGLVDQAAEELVYACEAGKPSGLQGCRLPLAGDATIGVAVARSGCALNTRSTPPGVEGPGACSQLCVPMKVDGRVIGVLCGQSSQLTGFSAGDEQLLQTLADQTAIAIENARLYRDVHAQMRTAEMTRMRLAQSEKLAALGELISGVAHELNNPLTAVILYAQLLRRGAGGDSARRDADQIVAQAQRAAGIVRGLLDFARQRPPERRLVQVNDVISGTLEFLAYELRTRNIACTTQLSPDLPLTTADSHQLQQVFVNLINNAHQAMQAAHGRGRLVIASELGPPQLAAARIPEASSVIHLSFADDGPGIGADELPRIFDPFFTTKAEGQGTGLGLSVCHGIVGEHGGHIWAESEPGTGATIHIELPVISPKAPALQPDLAMLEPRLLEGAAHVLVVDDEDSVLETAARALQYAGYRVGAVGAGEAALAYLQSNPCDLVVCDLHMPGMSGLDLYRSVRQKYSNSSPRFVFTTGDILSPSIRHVLEESGAPCLLKPFGLNHLLETIRSLTE